MVARDWSLIGKILLQLLELFAIYRYCVLTWGVGISIDNFRRIPYIAIIILLSFVNVTLLSKLLNRKFMERLGKLSLSMYLIHFPVATVYFMWLFTIKRGPLARSLPRFFWESGGFNRLNRPVPLGLVDLIIYIPLVIIVAILMDLLVTGIRRYISRRRL
jgi:peptidoglycan/LPS O-acetylase OafA/YrhL